MVGDAGHGFEDFVKGYSDRAFGFAYRLCGNVQEAQEYVQESFLRALSHWHEVRPDGQLEGWYFSILRNLAADGHRKSERRREVSIDESPSGWGTDTAADRVAESGGSLLDALEIRERDRAVRSALDAVPIDQRRVLVLVDMEGRSYDEIARRLDIPVGTVRSRVSRARLAFRKALCDASEVNP